MTKQYYECHITISPVHDEEKLLLLKEIVKEYKFKVAELLMQKRQEDTPLRSKYDTFMTGHSLDYVDLEDRMTQLRIILSQLGHKVWRYKIEHVILDVRL